MRQLFKIPNRGNTGNLQTAALYCAFKTHPSESTIGGVPVKVTDAVVVARIGVLLGAPDVATRVKPTRNRSDGGDGIAAA